jgi:cytochrome c
MNRRAASIVLAATLGSTLACGEKTGGSPDEAKALLETAVAHYQAVGREEAIADFNKSGDFRDRDLYVLCLNAKHVIIANGAFRYLVGTSGNDVKDADGNSLGEAMFNTVKDTGEGSVQYPWRNPATKQAETKVSFVRKIGDDVCGVGAYVAGKPKDAG